MDGGGGSRSGIGNVPLSSQDQQGGGYVGPPAAQMYVPVGGAQPQQYPQQQQQQQYPVPVAQTTYLPPGAGAVPIAQAF